MVDPQRAAPSREDSAPDDRSEHPDAMGPDAGRGPGEGLLVDVLDRITDGVYAVDYAWRLTFVNRRAETLWGRSRNELLGRVLWDLFPGAEETDGYRMHLRAARTREPVFFETLSPNLKMWVEARIYPGPSGLSVYFRDITDRKRMEESLRESEERLAQALAAAEIGTTTFDIGRATYTFDARARAMLGLDGPTVTREEVERRVHPDDLAEFREVRRRASGPKGPSDFHHRFRFRRSDGSERWITVHARVLFDGTGETRRPVEAVGAFLDVTAQVVAEEKMRAAKEAAESARDAAEMARNEAERANRAKDQFLSSISHELRTPLSAVIGYAELLEARIRGPLTDEQLRYVARIKSSAQHQATIIDEILTFSRTEAGKEVTRPQHVDLGQVAREVAEMLAIRTEASGLTVRLLGVDAPVPAFTDAGKVRQVLVNLVGNALKYTPEGHVEVEVEADDDRVLFSIRDTGPGIPADRLEDIFTPFTQLDQSHTREHGGTGLGLAICRRLARLLGGSVTVESSPGRGSTFSFDLARRITS
jgi:PAS domain S-box-containing protein